MFLQDQQQRQDQQQQHQQQEHKPHFHPFCTNRLFQTTILSTTSTSSSSGSSGYTGTARYIWSKYLDRLFISNSSIHPKDMKYQHHLNWTIKLLNILSNPTNQRLAEHSIIRALPYHYPSLDQIYTKLELRLNYIIEQQQMMTTTTTTGRSNNDDDTGQRHVPPPPIQIVIFGGSVVVGRGCNVLPDEILKDINHLEELFMIIGKEKSTRRKKTNNSSASSQSSSSSSKLIEGHECSWAYRLEYFINEMAYQLIHRATKVEGVAGANFVRFDNSPYIDEAGSSKKGQVEQQQQDDEARNNRLKLVQIHNLAVGGTSTQHTEPTLKYWLQSKLHGTDSAPDIVINGYSTNDNLPNIIVSDNPSVGSSKNEDKSATTTKTNEKIGNTTLNFQHAKKILRNNQHFIQNVLLYNHHNGNKEEEKGFSCNGRNNSNNNRNDRNVNVQAKEVKKMKQDSASFSATSQTVSSSSTTRTRTTYPIIFYIDNYIGFQQNSIVGEGTHNEMITLLSKEYQYLGIIGHVIPANMIRSWALANTKDKVFSPNWYSNSGNDSNGGGGGSNRNGHGDGATNNTDGNDKLNVEVHFGMSVHTFIPWAIAYAFLQTTIDFCDDDYHRQSLAMKKRQQLRHGSPLLAKRDDQEVTTTKMTTATSLPLNHSMARIEGVEGRLSLSSEEVLAVEPEKSPPYCERHVLQDKLHRIAEAASYVPPPPMMSVGVANVTEIWNQSRVDFYSMSPLKLDQGSEGQVGCVGTPSSISKSNCGNHSDDPCSFAFLAGPMGTHHRSRELSAFIKQFASRETFDSGGWVAEDDYYEGGYQNKLGLVAKRVNATMTLEVNGIGTPVRTLTIFYLKSYSKKWQNSTARFILDVFPSPSPELSATQEPTYRKEFQLSGYHVFQNSVSYRFSLDLINDSIEEEGRDGPLPISRHMIGEDLGEVAPGGSTVRINMSLVDGQQFKINGMLLCKR